MADDPATPPRQDHIDLNLDRSNLYLEESFTDLKVGTVKRLTPVKTDGTPDKSRKVLFVGETSLYTPHGPLPLQSPIRAKELAQAFKRFPEAMEEAMRVLMEEIRKAQQDEKSSPIIQGPESRIIVP